MRARECSTSLPYSTAEGQAVSQARQSRHLSMCSTKDWVMWGRAEVPFPFVGAGADGEEEFTTEGAEATEAEGRWGWWSEPMLARSVWATWIIWWIRPRGESASRFQRR